MSELAPAPFLSDVQIDAIADALIEPGYIVVDRFLADELAQSLLSEIHSLSDNAFRPAAIGRDNWQQLNESVRSNTLHWLTGTSLVQKTFLAIMEQLRTGINRRLFMGLFDFECHYSHYAPGDFYKRHVDAFKGASNRVLSSVFYLNPYWQSADQGQLVLYSPDGTRCLLEVEPRFNHCVIFLSDRFPHEVLETRQDRYSIAGWYRINATLAGQLDPPR